MSQICPNSNSFCSTKASTKLHFPTCILKSKVTGLQDDVSNVNLTGQLQIINLKERIHSQLKVKIIEESLFPNIFSVFGAKKEIKPKTTNNECQIEIYKKVGKERLLFSKGHSNFARFLEIGDIIYYQHSKVEFPVWNFEQKASNQLVSCSMLRKELALIAENRFEEAQKLV